MLGWLLRVRSNIYMSYVYSLSVQVKPVWIQVLIRPQCITDELWAHTNLGSIVSAASIPEDAVSPQSLSDYKIGGSVNEQFMEHVCIWYSDRIRMRSSWTI